MECDGALSLPSHHSMMPASDRICRNLITDTSIGCVGCLLIEPEPVQYTFQSSFINLELLIAVRLLTFTKVITYTRCDFRGNLCLSISSIAFRQFPGLLFSHRSAVFSSFRDGSLPSTEGIRHTHETLHVRGTLARKLPLLRSRITPGLRHFEGGY